MQEPTQEPAPQTDAVTKYTLWCRYRPGLEVPDARDLEWNLVPAQSEGNVEPYQWGYDTHEAATERAWQFVEQWQPGVMQVAIRRVTLPA